MCRRTWGRVSLRSGFGGSRVGELESWRRGGGFGVCLEWRVGWVVHFGELDLEYFGFVFGFSFVLDLFGG